MKKIALVASGVLLVAGVASAKQFSIVGSVHDLSTKAASTGEICVYCHTPHNAERAIPLWNRINPSAGSFQLYKESATLSPAAQASALNNDSISLFCMSCHDGATTMGSVKINPDDGNFVPQNIYGTYNLNVPIPGGVSGYTVGGTGGIANAKLGTNLKNTHPIGFDYVAAQGADSGLYAKTTVEKTFLDEGVRQGKTTAQSFLYGTAGTSFECASCHRVHDKGESGNFLRIENEQSNLCRACHNK